ncbi:MAG: DUF2339 domain-containing protein [Burkholderiales bacterium]
MAIILIFGGIAVGALAGGEVGAVVGLVAGLLLSSALEFRKTLQGLRERLDLVEQKLARVESEAAAAAATVSDAEEVTPSPAALAQQDEVLSSLARDIAAIEASAAPPAPSPPPPEVESTQAAPLRSTPSHDERTEAKVWQRLFDGNIVARIGIVLLFFGVAFLLKYAAEHGFLPPELRLAGVALGSVAMLVFGWRQGEARKMFGLALQGGGIGLLYLAVFAALRLYGMVSEGPAFVLFAVIGLFGVILALKQDAVSLAALGISGAFLAPILASTGSGSHVVLFGYYTLLNAAILAISVFKSWRALNVTGFLFTFVIGLTWGARYYRPEFFASTEPFLITFFLIYVVISILSARRELLSSTAYVDGALIFGVPVIAFSLQWAMVRDFEHGAALSAFVLALFYLFLWRLTKANLKTLATAFAALAVLFLTLAIYYGFAPEQIIALWALEGAALVWLGLRQERAFPRFSGLALQGIAALYFLDHANQLQNAPPVANPFFLGALIIAISALASSVFLHAGREKVSKNEAGLIVPVLLWGLAWWYFAGLWEINAHTLLEFKPAAMLAFVALSCLAGELTGRRMWFGALREQWWLLPVAMLGVAYKYAAASTHPLAHAGYVAWPLAFSTYYWSLQRIEQDLKPTLIDLRHLAALWLLAYLASWQLAWVAEQFFVSAVWPFSASLVVPAALMLFIVSKGEQLTWPTAQHYRTYWLFGAGALAAYVCVWSLAANLRYSGDPGPLRYLPLLNPLDLAQLLGFVALLAWREKWAQAGPRDADLILDGVLFTLGLLWLSGIVARTAHHWAGIPFEFAALFDSVLVQASLSLLWTLAALALMVFATRKRTRSIWIAGAALLALVTLKLFLVDLASSGTIERIVSFLGVGLLFLAVGYLSPVPPNTAKAN